MFQEVDGPEGVVKMEAPKHWTDGWGTRIKDKKTEKIMTLSEFALHYIKENQDSGLVYCDIESVYEDVESPGDYIIADECGRHEYINKERYEVLRPEICVFCGYDPSKAEEKRGRQWACGFTLHNKFVCGKCNDEIGTDYVAGLK